MPRLLATAPPIAAVDARNCGTRRGRVELNRAFAVHRAWTINRGLFRAIRSMLLVWDSQKFSLTRAARRRSAPTSHETWRLSESTSGLAVHRDYTATSQRPR